MKKVFIIVLLLASVASCKRSTKDVNAYLYTRDGADSADRDSVPVIVHGVPENINAKDVIYAVPDSMSTTDFIYKSDVQEYDTGDGKPQMQLTVTE